MKIKILILLSCLALVSYSFADPPSSASYTLVQRGFLAGNPNQASPPSSTGYELTENSMLGIANDEVISSGFLHFPGFLQPTFDSPINVTISVIGSILTINWDAVNGATSYKVYSSNDSYTGFAEDITGTFAGTSWSTSVFNEKKFYYVTAIF